LESKARRRDLTGHPDVVEAEAPLTGGAMPKAPVRPPTKML
jgi:hypothetical protein